MTEWHVAQIRYYRFIVFILFSCFLFELNFAHSKRRKEGTKERKKERSFVEKKRKEKKGKRVIDSFCK